MKLNKDQHYDEAVELFNSIEYATQVARELCEKYGIEYNDSEGRKVRRWLNPEENLPLRKGNYKPKVLIYDIETTLLTAVTKLWWPKEKYISWRDIVTEPQIISIAYKWLGDEKSYCLTWDNKKKCDKQLLKDFLEVYNTADAVVGVNNLNFDDRWVRGRAAKHRMFVDTFVKSIDIQKQAKSAFKLISYSMQYMAEHFGLTRKLSHAGITMWENIQQKENQFNADKALEAMVEYNLGDIATTEELYVLIQRYSKVPMHFGVLAGNSKWTCPDTGSDNVELHKKTVTAAGTVRVIMKSNETGRLYNISNRDYLRFTLENGTELEDAVENTKVINEA